jgi:hypothetical protein
MSERLSNIAISKDCRGLLIELKQELTYSEFLQRVCVLYNYVKENHKPTYELVFNDFDKKEIGNESQSLITEKPPTCLRQKEVLS